MHIHMYCYMHITFFFFFRKNKKEKKRKDNHKKKHFEFFFSPPPFDKSLKCDIFKLNFNLGNISE